MADIELVIKLSEEDFEIMKHNIAVNNPLCPLSQEKMVAIVANGTPLPKGHGRLIDEDELLKMTKNYKSELGRLKADPFVKCGIETVESFIREMPTIIEADKEYEAKVITRGNCMMCGKELTEGLFFCKECEAKATQGRK